MGFGLPDVGDFAQTVCTKLGMDEESADWVAAGVCIGSSDFYGAYEHGLDCVENVSDRFDAGQVSQALPPKGGHIDGYPAADDVEGWKQFLAEHGYEAFTEAVKNGAVGDDVFGDRTFTANLESKKAAHVAAVAFRSTMMASEDRLLQLIIQNMRG